MTFKSFLSDIAEKCGEATIKAFHAATTATKLVVDRAIANTSEIEKSAEHKLVQYTNEAEKSVKKIAQSAISQAESIGKKVYHKTEDASKYAYVKTAKILHTGVKKIKDAQKVIKRTFSKKHINDLIVACPRLKKGLDKAAAESKDPKFENVVTFLSGNKSGKNHVEHEEDGLSTGSKFEMSSKTGRSLFSEEKDGFKQDILRREVTKKLGVAFDNDKGLEAKAAIEVSAVVYKAELENKFGKNLVKVNTAVELLSGKGELSGSFKASKEGLKAEALVGAEFNVAKVEASGIARITPATLWNNTAGELFGCDAPKWLDYGFVLGATGEVGLGAAAKASASLEVDSKAVTGTLEAKLGFGPMAGFKLIGGFAFAGDE